MAEAWLGAISVPEMAPLEAPFGVPTAFPKELLRDHEAARQRDICRSRLNNWGRPLHISSKRSFSVQIPLFDSHSLRIPRSANDVVQELPVKSLAGVFLHSS